MLGILLQDVRHLDQCPCPFMIGQSRGHQWWAQAPSQISTLASKPHASLDPKQCT